MSRAIFCANAGRAGSAYLATILDAAHDVIALHEPEPQLVGEWVRNDPTETQLRVAAKVEAIRQTVAEADVSIYAETSNAFIKGRPEQLVDQLAWPVDVVVLRRHLASQIESFLHLGFFSFSGQETAWMDWMPLAGLGGTASAMPNGVAGDQVDRIIAYLIDTEARSQQLRTMLPDVTFHDAQLESIATSAGVVDLFHRLDLHPSAAVVSVIGIPLNTRDDAKVERSRADEVGDRLAQYEEALIAEGRSKELSHLRTLMLTNVSPL